MAEKKMGKYRVLRDFIGLDEQKHKRGDIVEMTYDEARAFVNSDKITADLSELPGSEEKQTEEDIERTARETHGEE